MEEYIKGIRNWVQCATDLRVSQKEALKQINNLCKVALYNLEREKEKEVSTKPS
jgi:hypothetical protein